MRCRSLVLRFGEIVVLMTFLLAFLTVPAPAIGAGGSVVAPSAKVEKLADGFAFTEGPAADAQGNVFFTDQPNDRILKWSVENTKGVDSQ